MKLLVTGGAGFIGSNFIRYWLAKYKKDKIVNLDKLTYAGNLENLREIEKNPRYQFIKGDICNPKIVREAIKGIDVVVHFAAETHVDRSIMAPAAFVMTNVIGTQILLDAALEVKIKRFHHVSTDEVFGALSLNSRKKFNEKTLFAPNSPYAASKAASDYLVRAYLKTYSLPITITNTSNNYGPYQFPEKLLPLAITNLLEGKKVPIYGDGLYVRDWLYVEDHCQAIDLVLKKGKVGETYCVGGMTKDIANLQVIKKICRFMGKNPDEWMEFVKDRPGHDRRYAIDWRKIKDELGWQPKYDFEIYLETTINWYINNQSWWKRIKSGEYQKYYQRQYGKR